MVKDLWTPDNHSQTAGTVLEAYNCEKGLCMRKNYNFLSLELKCLNLV